MSDNATSGRGVLLYLFRKNRITLTLSGEFGDRLPNIETRARWSGSQRAAKEQVQGPKALGRNGPQNRNGPGRVPNPWDD